MGSSQGEFMISKYQILKESINQVIQNSGLDIGAVYFILKDIFNEIEKLYYAQINRECLNEIKEETKQEKNKTVD